MTPTSKSSSSVPSRHGLCSDSIWRERYASLRAQARYLVYASNVSVWRGQEDDVSEDLVQETVIRSWERSLRVERGEMPPAESPERMISVVQRNHCIDLKRRERRLVRLVQNDYSSEEGSVAYEQLDPSEIASDNVENELLFVRLAFIIVKFPDKQRTALLIDLANRMYFETQPTPLQAAFLAAGIRLQDYQRPLSDDPVERSRHASLVSVAYKGLAKLARNSLVA